MKHQRGVSMIEVLIGILIITFGLLGLITLQARAIQVSVSSDDAQRAAMLADELAATMLNNGTVNLDGAITSAWSTQVASSLPSGTGTVTVNGSTARVEITWAPPQVAAAASASTPRYATDVVIP